MEYALLRGKTRTKKQPLLVLILVLMEYALLPFKAGRAWKSNSVLILVLMEYALLQAKELIIAGKKSCLNPCSNGICSLTVTFLVTIFFFLPVLILVLMEYALLHFLKLLLD